MKKRNYMSINQINGGGNFADAELAFNHHALFKGRLSSYLQVIAVLFVFLLSFSSYSNDKEEEEKIKIEDQTFMITSQADDLVLTNED